ncbi:ABC transporter ATP-binding protein [Ornithinimicrobium sp. INDO-MA30-4]|uniref:ABC transporter ATP-binding protein n=1 Tax=Ornithinimicrobium sp. INDO-MA30-4 TaxID=2908651 RepID=UPI001F28C1AF|nr:ABC transporter ATP-binding protein [Ornithinimicrobium sp. INDO-MA30-4]UJH70303.1 ABC transporter ATP-binding protein [Ornithinimicrobium sp. INDO-MA30-4]
MTQPREQEMPMLNVADAHVAFDGELAVQGAGFQLSEGQVLAILGPSGCGKSTLLRAIAGLEPLEQGRVSLNGRDLAGVPAHQRGFALMFQDGQLFAQRSVGDNVGYALKLQGLPRAERVARVTELLEVVGLPGYEERRPATLSGGEQQRVALARSLAAKPTLLLLDEPLSALDRSLRDRLATDLREILVRTKTTAIMVTHDHDEAFTMADRMGVMLAGQLVQVGDTRQVWREPVSKDVASFLGYTSFFRDAAAGRVAAIADVAWHGQTVGLRPSALAADQGGSLKGLVRRASPGAQQTRLVVHVEGMGEVDAIAAPAVEFTTGQEISLRLNLPA